MIEWILFLLGLWSLVLTVLVIGHIVMHKHNVRSAIGWAGLVLLAPFMGSLAYFLLGINRIQRKAVTLRGRRHFKPATAPLAMDLGPGHSPLVEQMHRLGHSLQLSGYAPGNTIKPLVNGDEAFPAMLTAIHNAKSSIALCSYIFDGDETGMEFVEALAAAQRRGVEVRVLIDDVGARYHRTNAIRQLRKRGVGAKRFLPTLASRFIRFANIRNHRKLLMVDGGVAFVGGMNIRHGNRLRKQPKAPIADIHFQVKGPIIDRMNTVFVEDWSFTTGETPNLPEWGSRDMPQGGTVLARTIPDGPDADVGKLPLLFMGAISSARQSIRIRTPYFLPNPALERALQVAALKGVKVEVLLPEKSNVPFFDWAMHANFQAYMEYGVRFFLSPPPFDHGKLIIVDQEWSSIGSSNWDARSFRLNFELNLECVDQPLARELTEGFDKKKAQAREIRLPEVRAYSFSRRLRNNFFRLFTPYL
ncbi:MAG: cardiolipin synthase [Desulfovibrio sp.]|nr:MAG: cardiolipin synthase [Desulfovibrio sp.]